ncbi:MAG: aminodeoxychorismate synthase component I [Methylophilaceae bacterium]
MLKHILEYHHDSAQLFNRVAQQPWAMLLDSGQMIDPATGKPGSQYGRYDIMVAEPMATLVTQGKQTIIMQNGQSEISAEDPFMLLKNLLSRYQAPKIDVPFAGGAVGYFAYDLARRIENLADTKQTEDAPEMMIGIYDWAIVVDHRERRSVLVSHGFSEETRKQWRALQALFDAPCALAKRCFEVTSTIQSNFTKTSYRKAFAQVQSYIEAGDCYQVNLAQRFSAQVEGDSWLAYQKLRQISPAPFMAYMQLPLNEKECFQVLSNSPERFIQTSGNHVETRPIKGTRPRSKYMARDLANREALQTSLKDRAENLMIVDLLRNDIGKNCRTGSVKVEKLFQLQSFANVHHLVSIITGQLKEQATAIDLLKGCFPGGSITGAPKVRAMQIIDELEPHRRGIYCGAIGYIGFDGNMDTSIAIRTAIIAKKVLIFCVGGGIVADSEAQKEYVETLDKASSIMAIMKHFMRF